MGGRPSILLAGALALALGAAAPAPAATIEVETALQDFAADGSCSLPEAVNAARTNQAVFECRKGQAGEPDVIVLQGEDYQLQNGLLLGGGDLTIRGQGGATELTAGDEMRPVRVEADTVTLKRLQVGGGETGPGVDGGNILVESGRLTLNRVTVLNGDADDGGNIYMNPGTRLDIARSTIAGGLARGNGLDTAAGGGIFLGSDARARISRSLIAANDATHQAVAGGGAIYADDARLTITDTSLLGNDAEASGPGTGASGGAIFSDGVLKLRRSLVAGNEADTGAVTSIGGGISVGGPDFVSIVNSTFFSNEADSGGAIRAASPMFLAHVTFAGNESAQGDHIHAANGGDVTLRNSILPSPLAGDACGSEGSGTVESGGFNLFELQDPECSLTGKDEVTSDAGLDPDGLEDNGGPTQTIGLTAASEAANLVPKRKCRPARGEDQRGFDRPKGRKCDAGAVERGAKP